jgi:hypothetical protein
MDMFLVVLAVAAAVVGVGAIGKYVGHFKIGDRLAARISEYKIQNAKPDLALNDPQLRALISCPGCKKAGDFELQGRKKCRCNACGTVWDVS